MKNIAKVLILVTATYGCSKKAKIPEPEKRIEVTYCVQFSKATDFNFQYNDTNGTNNEAVLGKSAYVVNKKIMYRQDQNNILVGACVTKSADINNCTMKVSAIVAGDTIKKCSMGTCCTVH